MNRKLENKVAVIVGGSAGIGVGAAKRSAALGARVFITGRRQFDLDNAVAVIEGNLTAIEGDASKVTDIDRSNQTVKTEAAGCALRQRGLFYEFGTFGEITEEYFGKTSLGKSAACSLRCRRRCTFFRMDPRLSHGLSRARALSQRLTKSIV
jgi:hypothetical protein